MSYSPGALLLGWQPNTESDLAGYKVYFGRATGSYTGFGSPVDVGNTTNYEINLADTGSWFIAITAYDTGDNESGFSSEIEVEVESLKFICA